MALIVKAAARKLPSRSLCFTPNEDERSTRLHPNSWRPRCSCASQWAPSGDGDVAAGNFCWRRCRCPLRCFLSCVSSGNFRSGTCRTAGLLQDNASLMPQRVDRLPFLTGSLAFPALGVLCSWCSGTSPVIAGLFRTTPLKTTDRYTRQGQHS